MRVVVLAGALLVIGLALWQLPRLAPHWPRLRLWAKLILGGLLLAWLGVVVVGALQPGEGDPMAALPEADTPLLLRMAVWFAPVLVLAAFALDLALMMTVRRGGAALLLAFSGTLLLLPLCALLAWMLLGPGAIGAMLWQVLKGAVFAWGGFALMVGVAGALRR